MRNRVDFYDISKNFVQLLVKNAQENVVPSLFGPGFRIQIIFFRPSPPPPHYWHTIFS